MGNSAEGEPGIPQGDRENQQGGIRGMKNNQNLFFSPEEKGRAFSDVLKEVQEYISSKYSRSWWKAGARK